MKKQNRSFIRVFVALWLVAGVLLQALPPAPASAAQITNRSLTLAAGDAPGNGDALPDGGSMPGGIVRHRFNFTIPTTADVGSIRLQYCTTAADVGAGTCIMPIGLDTTAATLENQVNAIGFSMHANNATNNGTVILTRPAASIPASTAVEYTLNNVTNPSDPNKSFYVRITTYTSTDATGSSIDSGVVVASTTNLIQLTGVMPESLVFCTGGTVGTTSGVPDCTTATGGSISFDRLFSATDTATATSQMAASTNAGFGYAVTVNGTTMTSGSNTINAMGTVSNPATTSIKGFSQFGLNLKLNTTSSSSPAVGAEVVPAANGTNYRGQAKAGYEVVDNFKFETGNVIAASDNGAPGGTDAQIFTKSYIVNVPGNQPAGTYTTTLTYIATPTF